MKLYFYIVDGKYCPFPEVQYRLCCEECEVVEKPKTYKPVDHFPKGYHYSFVNKDEIGEVLNITENLVVLTERDDEKAMKIFKDYYEGRAKRETERHNEKIKRLRNLVAAVEKGITEDKEEA